ncbi:YciI family protein [Anoxynatronum buryatiense]|uniref:YCII-related domain-containing protein n=1 Tax=Anoxynatronum buryatiense TaxID=489973 RepID=A0AA46AHW5_9CLOT|nr:YciI family protein [Anoxynatronum buryatiense]SMP44170.1 hypothetical protein SAMN06296020_102142 [Anoxynatronum buryatiense]
MILYAAILNMVDGPMDEMLLDEHKAYLQQLIDAGSIFAKGPFTDHSGGLVLYKADSYEEAMAMASQDPAIVKGSRTLTLKEWRSNLD